MTYTRSNRDQPLTFSIIGGKENGSSGIFISNVQESSYADKIGLKRGDQVLSNIFIFFSFNHAFIQIDIID